MSLACFVSTTLESILSLHAMTKLPQEITGQLLQDPLNGPNNVKSRQVHRAFAITVGQLSTQILGVPTPADQVHGQSQHVHALRNARSLVQQLHIAIRVGHAPAQS